MAIKRVLISEELGQVEILTIIIDDVFGLEVKESLLK